MCAVPNSIPKAKNKKKKSISTLFCLPIAKLPNFFVFLKISQPLNESKINARFVFTFFYSTDLLLSSTLCETLYCNIFNLILICLFTGVCVLIFTVKKKKKMYPRLFELLERQPLTYKVFNYYY